MYKGFTTLDEWTRNMNSGWTVYRLPRVQPAPSRPPPPVRPLPAQPSTPQSSPPTQPFSLVNGTMPELLVPPPTGASDGPVEPFPVSSSSPAKIISRASGPAPYETLFHEFDFRAIPVYNFWEQDEEASQHERGSQKLEDLPRYVKLSWIPAPDLPDPLAFSKRQQQGGSPDARTTFTQLSPFGFGSHQVVGVSNNGTLWIPPHLQPENFPQNARAISNGYIFPGALEAVVEVKTGSIAPPPQPSSHLVDEDQYLAHSEITWGVPFSEFNHALWRWKSRTYGAQQRMSNTRLSPSADLSKRNLVNGQYALAPQVEGIVDLRAVNGASPALSFYGFASNTGKNPQNRIFELADALGANYLDDNSSEFQRVKVKMLHTNLEGLMAQDRLDNMSAPQHAEAIAAIAPFAGNMAVYTATGLQSKPREVSIPSFNAPDTLKPLEYIGYIIEKYEQVDGSFQFVDTFYIPGRDYSFYFDSKVKYGVAYRYRIRAIIRWSRQHGLGVFGKDPTTIDAPGAGLNSLTPNDVSYFGSEWGSEWASALLIDTSPPPPPHQLQVRTMSDKKAIEITFCLPWNPQQDICAMTLWRKLQDQDGFDLTDWIQIQEQDAEFRQGTRHLYVAELQHQQDDITGTKFNMSQADTVETFVEFAPLNSRYVDNDVEYFGDKGSYRYVYAAMCHTRHGESSVLSDQLGARLNPDWKKDGEFRLDFVSCAGVNKDFDTGLFSTYPERRLRSEVIFTPTITQAENVPGIITLSGQMRLAQSPVQGAAYVARIESLDNGQRFDVPVTLQIKNKPEQNQVQDMTALVPVV